MTYYLPKQVQSNNSIKITFWNPHSVYSPSRMQYLLESDTWVERKPSEVKCQRSLYKAACAKFTTFTAEYKVDGCKQ